MPDFAVKVVDESGTTTPYTVCELKLVSSRVSIEEIIRAKVTQEVTRFNEGDQAKFQGLVQPSKSESVLNDSKSKNRKQISLNGQISKALDGFASNSFFVIIDDKQFTDLSEIVCLSSESTVSFVKLYPLAGG